MEIKKDELRKKFYLNTFKKMIWGDSLSDGDHDIFEKWKRTFKPSPEFVRHYSNKKVLFEIVKYLGNSEFIIGESIRHLYASNINNLLYCMYFYRVLENPKSMYRGLANMSERERPPFNPAKKREWQTKYWTGGRKEILNHLTGYDFGMDFDSKTFEECYDDARKVFDLLNKFKVRFSIWNSGKKGFHVIVPFTEWKHMIGEFNIDKAVDCAKALAIDLVKLLELKHVDSKIYSTTRYLKAAYTLDSRNNRVILPLDNREFKVFPKHPERFMSVEYCNDLPKLGFRGAYPGRPSNPRKFTKLIEYIEDNV